MGDEDDGIPHLLCSLGALRIGIRLDCIERVVASVEVTPLDATPEAVLGVIDFHGTIIPVYSGHRRIGMEHPHVLASQRFIVMRVAGRLSALCVDGVGHIEAVALHALEDIDEAVPDSVRVFGLGRSSDGLIVVFDMERFLTHEEEVSLIASIAAWKQRAVP